MNYQKYGIVAVIIGLAILAVMKRKTIMSYTYSDLEALNNPNVKKALDFIKKYESRGDYSTLYVTSKKDPRYDPKVAHVFTDYSQHPNVRVPFTMPNGKAEVSTAAGAYQINYPTWTRIQASRIASGRGRLPDFTPHSQDVAAIEILRMDGTLDSIIKGDWETALIGMSRRWASMPLDKTGQTRLALSDALKQLYA